MLELKQRKAPIPGMRYATVDSRASLSTDYFKFYNLILFMSSVAAFSLIAQRMSGARKALGT